MGKKKPSKRLIALVARLERGERLCKSVRLKDGGSTEVLFHYEPSGRSASAWAVKRAIDDGIVQPSGDGLFGAETSQTWALA